VLVVSQHSAQKKLANMLELILEPSILVSTAFLLLFSLFLVSDCGSFILDNVKGQLKTVVPEENIILITGCDTGFGAMASIELAKSGYNVVSACLTEEGKKSLEGKVALSILCDVTNEKDVLCLALATEDLAAKNKLRLWAVINNAGIAPLGNMDWLSMSDIKRVMDINYIGAVSVIKATLPELKKTRNSRIINISSVAGRFLFCDKFSSFVVCSFSSSVVISFNSSVYQVFATACHFLVHILLPSMQ
jgi:hypothetical protein